MTIGARIVSHKGEIRIHTQFNASFEQPSLEEDLARHGATHILLAGAATTWFIGLTAYGAPDRGYDLTLIKGAYPTETVELKDGTIIELAKMILGLNIAMRRLCYSVRTNGRAPAEEVDFAVYRRTSTGGF